MHPTAAASPHYLRFARALTLAAGLAGAAGCAASVHSEDAAAADHADPTDRVDPPDSTPQPDATPPDAVADANPCPATQPAWGTPCAPVGLMCNYGSPCTGETRCAGDPDAGSGTWQAACAIGPLPPPELRDATA